MFVVCGEALMDVFIDKETSTGLAMDARIGGSPLNVAVGLARLGQRVEFLGATSRDGPGERIRRALGGEGVGLAHAPELDAPTSLGLVSLDAQGTPRYAFHGHGCADRMLRAEHLPTFDDRIRALHFGSYTMVVEPVAATHRLLVDREHGSRLIAYDPNVRLQVMPEVGRWTETVAWMTARTHLVKVSSEDLELLHPGLSVRTVAEQWLRRGVRLVIVTCGGKGALAFNRREVVGVEAVRTTVVDTVGAGDTFQAALLTWLAENDRLSPDALDSLSSEDIVAALTFASTAAAITCGRRGADLPRREELGSAFGARDLLAAAS